MLRYYLIIAWRNLWKYKVFSIINLFGFTVSICVSFVVIQIVKHELSYDKYHADADRIFRVVTRTYILGEEYPNPGVPIPLAEAVKHDMTGIKEAVGFFRMHDYQVSIPGSQGENDDKILKHQNNLILTEPGYFRIFEHRWLAGDASALNDPFQVILTESKARSYFPINDPVEAIGREIIYQDSIQTVVSGIVKDSDRLTDFDFKEFISLATVAGSGLKDKWYLDRWDNVDSDFQLMVKLNENISPASINDQFLALRTSHQQHYDPKEQINELQPLSDLHFDPRYGAFVRPVANRSTLWGLIAVALLIVVLGSINYMNLTAARGNQRAAEIGIRKTLGGSRKSLAVQFVAESVLLASIAGLCTILITPAVIRVFHDYLPAGFSYSTWEPELLFLLVLCILIGLISGFYPGLILSRFKPISMVRKAQSLRGSGRSIFQTSLTVGQFVVATFFIATTWMVVLQIRYAVNLEMGFEKEGIIIFSIPNDTQGLGRLLQQRLTTIPEIALISRGGSSPAATTVQSRGFTYTSQQETRKTQVMLKYGDEHFLDVYGLKLLAGKNITYSDTVRELIINETYLEQLGIEDPSEAVGITLSDEGVHYPIIGVVSDFNTQPVHSQISPTAITNAAVNTNFHIRLKNSSNYSDSWSNAIDKMNLAWDQVYPDEPFNYEFYDQRIASWYQRDQRTAKLLSWITGVAILISCLGLLGLAILITADRTKEIGIRKVLGASVGNVVILLASGLIKLILIGVVLSIPIIWIFISKWLENFAYSIQIGWWMFALPALLVLAIAVITVSVQVFNVALANPVNSIRNE